MKKLIALLLCLAMLSGLTAALAEVDPNIKATLTFATWDNEAMLLFDELDIEGRFQELYPNVSIEIEEFKDDDEVVLQTLGVVLKHQSDQLRAAAELRLN